MSSRRRFTKQGKPARRSQRRPEKSTLLIVCEGRETERNYLDQLKREDEVNRHFAITIKKGKGGSRLQIVQLAVDFKNQTNTDFDEVWCVMDVESQHKEEAVKDLMSAIESAAQNQVTLCLSNPVFEVWLLAHFVRSSKSFKDCDAVILFLNKHWKKEFKQDYSKSDRGIYQKISDRTLKAIQNAKAVREKDHGVEKQIEKCNSATEIYRLVLKLIGKDWV